MEWTCDAVICDDTPSRAGVGVCCGPGGLMSVSSPTN